MACRRLLHPSAARPRNHVWAYDFVSERTHDGRKLRLLTVVDEYTRECLAIRVERRMTANDVLWVLADLFLEYGIPEHISSRQWTRVRRHSGQRLAGRPRRHHPVHRTGLALGERLRRVLQRQAARRALKRRDLLHAQGGADPDGQLAAALQRPATSQLAWLPSAGAGDDRLPGLRPQRLRPTHCYAEVALALT